MIEKMLTLPPSAVEDRARKRTRPAVKWVLAAVPVLFLVALMSALSSGLMEAMSRRPVQVTPRHRAEALCFSLAQPPRFSPGVRVTPSAALVQTNLSQTTPPAVALQYTMKFTDEMVLRAASEHVGDYDVASMWLRIPDDARAHLWLVVCWMEGSELAVSNFRFAGDASVLTAEHETWGGEILERVLVERFFEAGVLPDVTLRVRPDQTAMPVFGPTS